MHRELIPTGATPDQCYREFTLDFRPDSPPHTAEKEYERQPERE
jgi:hypothetical protein